MSFFKTFAIDFAKFRPGTAPHSSNLGMFVDFRGATCDFDIAMLETVSPLVWEHLAYTAAPYAFFDASIKTCNEKEHQSPDGTKLLGTLIRGNSFKS